MNAASAFAVQDRRPRVAVLLQSRPRRLLELVEHGFDLLVGWLVVRRPRDHCRRVLPLEVEGVGHGGHQVRVAAQDFDALALLSRRVPLADEILDRRAGRALPVGEKLNEHRHPPRRCVPRRAATARRRRGGRSPRRPRPTRRGCSPTEQAGSGCCRSARSVGCARARRPVPMRSRSASAPSRRAAARTATRPPPPLFPPGGVFRGRDPGGDHHGAMFSHGRTGDGVRGPRPRTSAAPPGTRQAGGSKGGAASPRQPRCSTSRVLASRP